MVSVFPHYELEWEILQCHPDQFLWLFLLWKWTLIVFDLAKNLGAVSNHQYFGHYWKKICFYVILLQIYHFFPCVFTYQDRTSIEFKLVVEELEDLVKIVVVSALLLILSSSIWIPMVGTDKNSILRKSLGFGIPEGGLWWYSVML